MYLHPMQDLNKVTQLKNEMMPGKKGNPLM